MRVLVTGDRRWFCPDLAEAIVSRLLARYGPDIVIVHGDAAGVDRSFAEACLELGVRQERHPADWDRHGRGAGPRRNQEMVDLGADLCLAVHPDIAASKGTRDCAARAIRANIRTYVVEDETGTPRRLTAEDPRLG